MIFQWFPIVSRVKAEHFTIYNQMPTYPSTPTPHYSHCSLTMLPADTPMMLSFSSFLISMPVSPS